MSLGVLKTAKDAMICKSSSRGHLDESRQSPLIDRFYSIRAQVFDNILRAIIQGIISEHADIKYMQIIILGTGLDDSYCDKIAAFLGESKLQVRVFEVDLPEIIAQRQINSRHTNIGMINVLCSCDLRNPELLLPRLIDFGLKLEVPTLSMAECVLSYIPTICVKSILSKLSNELKCGFFISYEPLINESIEDGFSMMMKEKFLKRGAPLLHSLQSADAWQHFIQSCDWYFAASMNLGKAWALFKDSTVLLNDRPFDEYASLALLLLRYCITLASSSDLYTSILDSYLNRKGMILVWSTREKELLDNIHTSLMSIRARLDQVESTLGILHENANTLHIRPPKSISELEQARSIYLKSFDEVSSKFKSVQKFVKNSTKQMFDELPQNNDMSFLATVSDSVIGHARLTIKPARDEANVAFGEISGVCVDMNHRRKGVANELMTKILSISVARKLKHLELTVIEGHTAARILYERMGFALLDESTLKDSCCMYHMRKTL